MRLDFLELGCCRVCISPAYAPTCKKARLNDTPGHFHNRKMKVCQWKNAVAFHSIYPRPVRSRKTCLRGSRALMTKRLTKKTQIKKLKLNARQFIRTRHN